MELAGAKVGWLTLAGCTFLVFSLSCLNIRCAQVAVFQIVLFVQVLDSPLLSAQQCWMSAVPSISPVSISRGAAVESRGHVLAFRYQTR